MQLNIVDLFSGIGGFSLGLHNADKRFKTIAFAENDPFCQKVLKKNFGNTKIFNDIREVSIDQPVFLVCGGFPCQPFSTAGKRKGTEDNRYLFPEMLNVIKQTKPRWVIGENVQGIVNMSEGQILQRIHNDLESIGYEVQSFIIPANSQGAWHKRNRVWIIASNSNELGTQVSTQRQLTSIELLGSESKERGIKITNSNTDLRGRWGTIGSSGDQQIRELSVTQEKSECETQDFRSKTLGCDAVPREKEIQNTNDFRRKRHRLQSDNLQKKNSTRKDVNSSAEKQQTWWEIEQQLRGVPDGISYGLDKDRAKRIKALGNAIVPQIAEIIGKAIIKSEEDNNTL